MTDGELEAVLRNARLGLSPADTDARRVRAGLDVALAGGAPDPLAEDAPVPYEDGVPAPPIARWARLGSALALATVTAAGGYVLGHRAGSSEAPRTAERADLKAVPTAAPTASMSIPVPTTVLQPVPDLPEARARAPRRGTEPVASAATTPPSSGESSLELETRLLTRVERALRDDNPRLALGLLGELDRVVPGGQLAEERQAGRVVAHCEFGSDTAPKLAAEFAARYPSSAYGARVRAACSAPEAEKATR